MHDEIKGADVFLGVSAQNVIDSTDVQAMGKDPIVFAMANPDPEIMPEKLNPPQNKWPLGEVTIRIKSTMFFVSLAYSKVLSVV